MIEIKNLCKQYGTLKALDNVSFTVGDNQVLGFLGPNGSGKTTTMNIICGYLAPTSGQVLINGNDTYDDPVGSRALIGYLPEIPPLYPDMTVDEYINFVYDLKKCKLDRVQHLKEIYEVSGLKEFGGRLIRNLSKGFKQRVGIAGVLVGNPPIMIFDEPTAGLDPKEIVEIRSLIRTLGRTHTVILSTHILPEAQAVCDRLVIIKQGRVIADQKTSEISKAISGNRRLVAKICGSKKDVLSYLRSMQGISYVEVAGETDMDSVSYYIESERGVDIRKTLFNSLSSKGWPLIGLESMDASLEDVFLALTDEKIKADNEQYERNMRRKENA